MGEADKPTYEIDLDKLIGTLKENIRTPGVRVPISELECIALCCLVKPIFQSENMLVRVQAPVKVCGDIHGQFYDLLRLFDGITLIGDRSLLRLLVCCSHSRSNIRGDFTCLEEITKELKERFGKSKIHKHCLSVFNVMPVAAVIENSIFCCHGGLSPDLMPEIHKPLDTLINQIQRPTEIPRQGLLCDLVWSDPADYTQAGDLPVGWLPSTRGCAYNFGVDVINTFLDTYELDLVVRAHQVVEDGYEFYYENRLITLFSAPNYCNQFQNSGGVFVVRKADEVFGTLEGGFEVIRPDTRYQFNFYTRKHHTDALD
ncbi:hypothetical protein AHF37_12066 [Paragonimus kellicotti]|nr:hypothetical protein AHF37_12066 [Paragonimus kellicotti]